ncbi:hypothetical protein EK21DRAFT_92454 [Setomelanomma holmii]|uniref:Uncharacterized protein n=1 Tax=Setomelanomma holmii TaxID=210430 RepID=A0A9P4H2K5_9PLEO|nr:hypothetical protein EK21DRAFT_92454 [Setomelanomma holmii]
MVINHLMIELLAGPVVFGFQSQFSSRRLKSRRLAIPKDYFVIFLPTRLIFTFVWVCILSAIDHTREQKFLSLACLLDILLIVQFCVALWTQLKPYDFIGVVKPGLAFHKKEQNGSNPTGFISDAKATTVVEPRKRQYGPRLGGSESQLDVIGASAQPGVIYANREWCDQENEKGGEACTLRHVEEPLDERRELRHFRDFRGCACYMYSFFASPPTKYEDDLECASSNLEIDMRSQERQVFHRKSPIGVALDFVPS